MSLIRFSTIVACMLAITACGKEPKAVVVDNKLLVYALRFEQEMGVSTEGISMNFGDLKDNTVGLCAVSSDGRDITIDLAYWNTIEEFQREELMYHELGHCAMGLNHDSTVMGNGCPLSIMYPETFEECYSRHQSDYKNDLRGRKK